jgi:hypothetical protein
VARRQVAGIAPAFHESLSFARAERLHHDLRVVPLIGASTCDERKEHGLPSGQHLWAVRDLAALDAHEHLRLAAARGDAQDAGASLADLSCRCIGRRQRQMR